MNPILRQPLAAAWWRAHGAALPQAHATGLECLDTGVTETLRQKAAGKERIKRADAMPKGSSLERRFKQITGKLRKPGQLKQYALEVPDPKAVEMPDGTARVCGSGKFYLEYASMDDFLANRPYRRVEWDLRDAAGRKLQGRYPTGGLPWDVSLVVFEDGTQVLIGGAMTPADLRDGAAPGSAGKAVVARDNWSRSVTIFDRKVVEGKERWVQRETNLFGKKIGARFSWKEHSYGAKVLMVDGRIWRDSNGDAWVFYERVSEERDGMPYKTERFARRFGK